MTVLLVAIAGAAGALARYGIGTAVGPRHFPWPTLGINLAGSFVLGFVIRTAALRGWSDVATVAIGVGFLGAFTTFSTFSVETQTMLRNGRSSAAIGYVLASVIGGVVLAAAGFAAATSRGT